MCDCYSKTRWTSSDRKSDHMKPVTDREKERERTTTLPPLKQKER
jgi:hypothetical protein